MCTGYSASSDHAPYVSDALQDPFAPAPAPDDLSSRGACTWSAEWWIASAYYSCGSAFAQARACNLANKAAKDNGSCAEAECGAGEFALGGKCLALSASGGRLEHAPTGAGNALPAGSHVIAMEMTQTDLLGTVRLDVTATIERLSLNAAEFSLSEPYPSSVVTVASGAVNVELARVSLTAVAASVSVFGAHVSGVDQSAFPANLSLEILPVPENQTVVFYLSGTLAAGSEAERTATLEVASLDPNYAPVGQTVTLRIETLPHPSRAEAVGQVGAGSPYNSATLTAGHLHDFKTGRYATATNFVVDPSSAPELTVDADTGIVATNGDITAAGIYVLIVSVASPDYVGRARLVFGLTLEGVLTDAETIADGDRSRTVAVASGHSGSVAFFAAGRAGVTLRTPSSAPSGFNLGADGLDADFAAPAGFTLFLDAGGIAGGETATAAFAVTAKAAGFAASEISLTVVVSALAAPLASARGETFGPSPSFEGDVVDLAGAGYEDGAYAGARFEETSSSDLSVAADGRVSTREKLGVGEYLLTVTVRGRPDSRASADAFIGEATITVSLRVARGSEAITADDVVGASARHVTLDAVAGYFGRGYQIPVSANYTLSGETYDSAELGYDDVSKVITILSGNRVPASGELTLTLSGDGGCADGTRTCPTVPVSVTAVFRAVAASVAQNAAAADYLRGFTADLSFPSGYESAAGRVVKILYPLPREGALAGSEAVCKALGGAHTAGLDVCTGYSASSDHAPYVSDALQDPFAPAPPPDDLSSRGACTWSAEWWIASAYYSCGSAFAQARACNLANKAAKDNGSCAEAECGAGEFALGGKCLALSASGGRLEHAPTGAGNALPAGSHVIAMEMTQTDLLGTVRLDVTATIERLSLNAAEFSLSEPYPSSVVTVASGAVNVELARVSLTAIAASVSEFGAHVSGVDQSAFPANLSLEILPVPENQTVVFYLSGTLAAGSEAERTATLEVASLDPNYAPVGQTVTLRIETLPHPSRAEAVGQVGAGSPYNSATLTAGHLHNFKTGRYATATNFVVDPSSSPELTVDADTGIVATNGDITAAGIYVLIVSVASPDYVGRARLVFGLTLERVFTDAETIADGDRSRTVAVASGHSGSVAFFAAGRDGVALRTPSSAPSGFNLGADGLDADFAAPAGFTLFLDAGGIAGGETATAAFAVTATDAFFAASEISLTVIVSALAAPLASASGETFGLSASFEGDVVDLAGAGYEEGAYAGARFEETSSSDLSVAADGQVSTREKLGVGEYLLTVTVRGRPDSRASADAFIGEATITVSLRVARGSEAITADDVVGASARHVTLDAVAGYFGRGYQIPVSANYTLSGESYDSAELGYDDVSKVITILSGNRVPASGELTLTLSGDGGCADGIRTCPTVPVTVTAVFRAVAASVGQNAVTADYLRGFTANLNFPSGYENVGGNVVGRVVKILYPLPREGALAGSEAVCKALGGTHTAGLDVCTGYSASSDHAPYVSDALQDPFAPAPPPDDLSSRGACTWSAEWWIASAYYSCGSAFAQARACNLANKAAKDNGSCAEAECGAGEFALGGKCLALSASGGRLEHAPTGAGNALPAGSHVIAMEMTQTDLLGTVRLDVTATIERLSLNAAEFSLSEPYPSSVVTVASGAVNVELARVSLTAVAASVSEFGAHVSGVDQSAFPANLSLEILPVPENQTVVFYLSGTLAAGSEAERTATLEVASLDPNYAPVGQTVTLRIETLPHPSRAEAVGQVGAGSPYNSATLTAGHLHDFKTGRYATATNFVVDPSSSPELTVDADTGIVATNGDITAAGIYVLIVSVESPAYVGRARLVFGLTLEGVLTDAETIADGDRSRTVAVASGHSGSVAFFAAGRAGVTLRTPSSAPSGFNLGADGLDADFAAPAGFTLFLDAGGIAGGETATAAFAVTAKADAVFAASEISLTVVVSALAAPLASASGETFGLSASFEGDVVDLAGAGYEEGAYAGARFEETSSSDLSVAADGRVSTREKLGVGDYLLTVTVRGRPDSRASADAFIGEATITVSLRVARGSEAITADDVVGASARHVTVDAVAGYFGRGYQIPVSANYTLSGESYDSAELGYDDVSKVITILSGNRVPSSGELTLTLSGDGGCADGIRTCPTVPVSVTAVFRAVAASVAQNAVTADYLRGFTANLNFPSGYENVGGNVVGRVVKILYPLPREGALAGSEAVCKALGGTHTAGLDVCTGYSASSDHAPYVSDALQDPFAPAPPPDDLSSRGACTWSAEWWIASAYYSCGSAFAQARACNLANKAAKDNGSCAEAECGAGEFALGGKCLALSASGGRLGARADGGGERAAGRFACDCDGDDANGFAGDVCVWM